LGPKSTSSAIDRKVPKYHFCDIKKTIMTTVNLNQLELNEFIAREDEKQHCKATFPLIGAHGARQLATVFIELAPGDNLGRHTDSAEELLIVLEGDLMVQVGSIELPVSKGSITLVPKMMPHDIRNAGKTTAKVLGVFGGANNIVATAQLS
jgi:quercetin dioxygenase-like cupin family protein